MESTGSVAFALWIGFLLCVMSLVVLIVLCALDAKRDKEVGDFRDFMDPVRCTDIKYFDSRFWFLAANCLFVYICVFPFNNVASIMLQERFGLNPEVSGFIMVRDR